MPGLAKWENLLTAIESTPTAHTATTGTIKRFDFLTTGDTSSNDVALTLPPASLCLDEFSSRVKVVTKIAGANDLTVDGASSDTINAGTAAYKVEGTVIFIGLASAKWMAIEGASTGKSNSFTIPLPFTLGNRSGPNSDGVQVGVLTHTAFTDVTQEENSGAVFTDETADAGDAGADDVAMPDPFDTSDALYMGYTSKFCAAIIQIGTAGAGDAAAAETLWEYYNGSAWVTLETGFELLDSTTALEAGTSTYVVSFVPPSAWATVAVDGGTACYFIRFRATADDVFNTTQPTITQMWCVPLDVGQGLVVPYAGTITAVDLIASTASATNDDTELLLVNVTQGTFAQLTWTGADTMDRVASLTLAVAEDDQLALVVTAEDGTTEFANGSLELRIDL